MSRCFVLLAVAVCGCKSAEVAVVHPATGVQVLAKFESFEPADYANRYQLPDRSFETAAERRVRDELSIVR
jgi:hypothetical protein